VVDGSNGPRFASGPHWAREGRSIGGYVVPNSQKTMLFLFIAFFFYLIIYLLSTSTTTTYSLQVQISIVLDMG